MMAFYMTTAPTVTLDLATGVNRMIIQFPTYAILKQEPSLGGACTRSGRIILVERHDEEHRPFVTARLYDGDHQWTSGNYFETLDWATRDYFKRCFEEADRAVNQRKFKDTTERMLNRHDDNVHA